MGTELGDDRVVVRVEVVQMLHLLPHTKDDADS
jgi:hypothetical protein